MSKFLDYLETEIVCERKVTERGKKKRERFERWLNEVLSRPEVLGVVGWIQFDCEDSNYEEPFFIVFVKKGELPVSDDDPFGVRWFYRHKGVKNRCPGMIWSVVEVDEMPEFTKDDIAEICWCSLEDTCEVWKK